MHSQNAKQQLHWNELLLAYKDQKLCDKNEHASHIESDDKKNITEKNAPS